MPGIKGQKWGVRRYQNEDGTLTEEGKLRYGYGDAQPHSAKYGTKDEYRKTGSNNFQDSGNNVKTDKERHDKAKNIMKIAGGVALASLAGFMAYKIGKQWTGNLRRELRTQALGKANNLTFDIVKGQNSRRRDIDDVKILRARMKEIGRNRNDEIRLHTAMKNARDMSKAIKATQSEQERLLKIAKNATRKDALRNYYRNGRKIVVS